MGGREGSASNDVKVNLISIVSPEWLISECTLSRGCFKLIMSHHQLNGKGISGGFLPGPTGQKWEELNLTI